MYVNVWCCEELCANWVACEADYVLPTVPKPSEAGEEERYMYILKAREGYLSKAQIHYFIVRLMFWLPTLLFTSLLCLCLYPALLVSSHEQT